MQLTRLERLEQEVSDKNISLYYRDTTLKGFCIKDNICISKNLDNVERFWVLEHELQHLELGQLYTIDSTNRQVAIKERKVNDAIIRKYKLDDLVIKSFQYGLTKWELCHDFEMPFELYDATIDYLKRKGMI